LMFRISLVCLASCLEVNKDDGLSPETRKNKWRLMTVGLIAHGADWSALRASLEATFGINGRSKRNFRSGLPTEESPGQSNCRGRFDADHVATEI
uniref:HTH_Tnp_Tc3_1 domain-containing protein n=1 Tax=Haemonchus placei TaxID=6290 RepID=A0A0N4W1L0_HAEPC